MLPKTSFTSTWQNTKQIEDENNKYCNFLSLYTQNIEQIEITQTQKFLKYRKYFIANCELDR